ncbi:hypothetical protein BJV78DRAFT_1122074 [Lactifluus subvellereus]|nr:hypothetical protein BJV78DRAFT_1122074 [Lactifluus subvellereus]
MDRYHVGGGVSALVYTFDRVAGEIPEDEDDLHDVASSEYRDSSHIGLEKEPAINLPPKPRLSVRPPIWAQSRQEVCESLDSFRSFQGGVYQSNDIVKGYLLGAHSSSRDLFHHGGRLIISHGGGKAEALRSKNGRLEIQGPEDQLEDDRSVRALLNNYRTGRPLVVLADNNYVLFPFDLTGGGYTYVVLGLYWIAHAWAELQQIDENHSVVRYKFAFQWCEGQGDPWWTQGTEATPTSSSQPEKSRYCCPCCRSTSPLVYQDAPMCLQPSCAEFWRVGGEDPATHNTLNAAPRQQILSYSTELLRLRPPNHIPVSAESLYPPLPDASNTTPRPFAKGIHCRHCGRLSTRFKWEHFECSHCHRIYGAPPISFSHKDFWLQEQTLKFYQHRVAEDSGIVIRGMEFRSRTNGSALPYVQTFDLPYNRGSVHLIPGHPSINGRANDLFREYQKQAATGEIQFRRWPLRAVSRGQLLSNYFSQNSRICPCRCRSEIADSKLGLIPRQYVGGAERTTPLEDGAEPVLGALDLIRHRIATALGKGVTFNEVLSAAYMEKQKMAGDVLVMEGAGVQEYYEHAVVPKNFRIVATARSISPENYET